MQAGSADRAMYRWSSIACFLERFSDPARCIDKGRTAFDELGSKVIINAHVPHSVLSMIVLVIISMGFSAVL